MQGLSQGACVCFFLTYLCQISVIRKVREIHNSFVREILHFRHTVMSILKKHTQTQKFGFFFGRGTSTGLNISSFACENICIMSSVAQVAIYEFCGVHF